MRAWVFVCVVAIGILSETIALRAATQPVTFTFTHVKELNCDEEFGEACSNDFFPKAEIDNQGLDDGQSRFCCAHGVEFDPNWVFSRDVDTAKSTINLQVQLWDQDDLSFDDPIDIASGGSRSLDIVVKLSECTWSAGSLSGKVNESATSKGSGSDSAEITFTIASDRCKDSDGDSFFDGWEIFGYDADGNGTIDVNLPAMGAHAQRKDIFLEIDYLNAPGSHSHAPLQGAIRRVVQAFTSAPIGNPDGTSGIQLHVDVGPLFGAGTVVPVVGSTVNGNYGDHGGGGNVINEAGNAIIDWDGATGNPAVNFFTLKNSTTERRPIFRYVLSAHQTNFRAAANDCTSGWALNAPGVNFMVTLGGVNPPASGSTACWGVDGGGQSVGSETQQAGTLMHEFGHVLGLQHGGNDGFNNKPNYLSVMNYAFQMCQVPAIGPTVPGTCDFSRLLLPGAAGLNESSLDECQNIDNGTLGLGANNWNGDLLLQGASNCQPPNNANVPANINGDFVDTNNNGTQDAGEANILSVLNGFQDWNAIVYNFRKGPSYWTAGVPGPQDANPEDIARARAALAERVRPGLSVDKTGPADARPGDTLSYTVTVRNIVSQTGRGAALGVSLVDTMPDGSSQTFSVGNMALGASASRALTFAVPCAVTDGTVITNLARATASDLVSNEVVSTATLATTIHAPVIVLAMSATPMVNAGEAIAYTLSYQNTGSAPASNVNVTVTLPAGVYYSGALDQGAGPKPDNMTVNPDGTRTLVWNVGALAQNSASRSVVFTARPTLLDVGGTTHSGTATATYQHGGSCTGAPMNASSSTTISVVALAKNHDPEGSLIWKLHRETASAETRARIQATDQRFDGRDGTPADGALSVEELTAVFKDENFFANLFNGDRNRVRKLEKELLALYFNLADRRLNAETAVDLKFHPIAGVITVREAAFYAHATLAMPSDGTTRQRYEDTIHALDELND